MKVDLKENRLPRFTIKILHDGDEFAVSGRGDPTPLSCAEPALIIIVLPQNFELTALRERYRVISENLESTDQQKITAVT
jgi:hypothetical protein